MRIHTVKEGDTVFKIARKYSIPPSKIIENNALVNPDRLYPGQKLVILIPTRSYTVRGGDTLDSIAKRFSTDINELKRNNPSLMGTERIYPGQILAVKYEPKAYGNTVMNGYFSKGCSKDKLSLYLPHLTYITFAAAKWEAGRLLKLFDYQNALKASIEAEALPILRIYTDIPGKELLREKKAFIENSVSVAKEHEFHGLSVSAAKSVGKEFCDFFKALKHETEKNGLELHLEIDGNGEIESYKELNETADVSLLNYSREAADKDVDFESCEKAFLEKYAETCHAKKTLLDLFTPIYVGENTLDFRELEKLLIMRGISPDYSERTKRSSFKLKHYSGGQEKELNVCFETPENIKAKLEILSELGYMGVSFDIERSPVSSLMTCNSLFHAVKAAKNGNLNCRGERLSANISSDTERNPELF